MTTDFVPITETPGAKMMYLIRRRPTTSREELLVHWFANHMPPAIRMMERWAEKGRPHAKRYIATLFDADRNGHHALDGMAQLWWDEAPPPPDAPFGTEPTDMFQVKAEPYVPWETKEYVVMDGADRLSAKPNALNAPYPMTRSGFFKITFLVVTKSGADHAAFFDHWRTVHATNVEEVMRKSGGFRYLISHSIDPENEPYAGMAELYFPNAEGWKTYRELIKPDGMEQWAADTGTLILRAQTEMVGIP